MVSDGAEFVSDTADSTSAGPGGIQFVQGSGHANSTLVSGVSAFQVVNSGGVASGSVVASAGLIDPPVSSGSTLAPPG